MCYTISWVGSHARYDILRKIEVNVDFLCRLIKDVVKLYKISLISLLFFSVSMAFSPVNTISAQTITSTISDVCFEYNISESLVYCVIKAESNFNEKAVSHCDARGLMQITRPTWDWITEEYLKVDWDYDTYCFDSEKNIIVGVRFLKWIEDYLDARQDLLNAPKQDLLLACYNAGPGNVRKHDFTVPPFEETQNYVKKINLMFKISAAYLMSEADKS